MEGDGPSWKGIFKTNLCLSSVVYH